MSHNPYNAPHAYGMPQPSGQWGQRQFVSLGWRTTLAIIAIGISCIMSFALDIGQLAFASELKSAEPPLGASLLVGLSALGLVGSVLMGALFFCLFIHRAASNVLALGRNGMEFTPGWCVGWFFVPFANLAKPYQAVSEVWRSSDPNAGSGNDWLGGPPAPTWLGVWWGAWVLSNVAANVSGRFDDPSASGTIGLIGSVAGAVAGTLCCSMMLKLAARQTAAAATMSARSNQLNENYNAMQARV